MTHLPLWYIGELNNQMCDQIVHDLLPNDSKSATMGVDGNQTNVATRKTTGLLNCMISKDSKIII